MFSKCVGTLRNHVLGPTMQKIYTCQRKIEDPENLCFHFQRELKNTYFLFQLSYVPEARQTKITAALSIFLHMPTMSFASDLFVSSVATLDV